jgi:hypothetical protein
VALKFIEGFETYFSEYEQQYEYINCVYDRDYYLGLYYPVFPVSNTGLYSNYCIMITGVNLSEELVAEPHGYIRWLNAFDSSNDNNKMITLGFRYKANTEQYIENFKNRGFGILLKKQANDIGYGIMIVDDYILYGNIQDGLNPYVMSPTFQYEYQDDNNWHYIELNVINSGYTLKLDNNMVAFSYGDDITSNISELNNIYITRHRGTGWLDDIYITDGNPVDCFGFPTALTGFIPHAYRCRVRGMFPSGEYNIAWNPNDGITNYNLINEVPIDGDDTYISTIGYNQKDEYVYNNAYPEYRYYDNIFDRGLGTIYGIQLQTVARNLDNSTPYTLKPFINGSGLDTFVVSVSSYQQYNTLIESNPDQTGEKYWLTGPLESMKIGVEIDE